MGPYKGILVNRLSYAKMCTDDALFETSFARLKSGEVGEGMLPPDLQTQWWHDRIHVIMGATPTPPPPHPP